MIEPSRRPGFLLEALQPVGVGTEPLGNDFDGDIAREAGVACVIHLAHAACADERNDFIHTEASAGGQAHSWLGSRDYMRTGPGLQLIPR